MNILRLLISQILVACVLASALSAAEPGPVPQAVREQFQLAPFYQKQPADIEMLLVKRRELELLAHRLRHRAGFGGGQRGCEHAGHEDLADEEAQDVHDFILPCP